VFTNPVAGTACVAVHLGYGRYASSAEFTNIRLDEVHQ
jgi:hypothetical protein